VGVCAALAANWNDLGIRDESWPPNPDDAVLEISTPAQLGQFAHNVINKNSYPDKTITLTGDIDLGGNYWTPAGAVFNGTFDGKGHVISNLTIDVSGNPVGEVNLGLFGVLEKGSVVKNIRFEDISINGVKDGSNVIRAGAVAGVGWKATVENCTVSGSINVKNIT